MWHRPHLRISRRFNILFNYDRFNAECIAMSDVADGNEVIFTTEPLDATHCRFYLDGEMMSRQPAVLWLNEHYPDWQNPGAYWN